MHPFAHLSLLCTVILRLFHRAMAYLDRVLARRTVTKKSFQLCAMTCLFLAIKLTEPEKQKLTMGAMLELSRGFFSLDQVRNRHAVLASCVLDHQTCANPYFKNYRCEKWRWTF